MCNEMETRVLGYCEECGNAITDEKESYVDKDGYRFCSVECVLEYYEIELCEA